jgi:imidazolonepropionase-like amidohydrolase
VSTRVIDAAGKIVVPGINDAHVHIGENPPDFGILFPDTQSEIGLWTGAQLTQVFSQRQALEVPEPR